MNLTRMGVAALLAAILLLPASPIATKTVQGHAQPSAEPKDELSNWADPWQPSMPIPTVWKLYVHRLIEVREEYANKYIGAALINDDESCFALIGKKDDRGNMGAWMYSRHNNSFGAKTDPLSRDEFSLWIATEGLECVAEAAKKA